MKHFMLQFMLSAMLLTACMAPYKHLHPLEFSELKYPFPVKYLTLKDDIRIAYVDEGSGDKTIIFIHGLGSYLPAWQKNIRELKNRYRCIALDLPGYGKSSRGDYPYGMAFYADVVKQFMEALHLSPAVIAGHSMGGQIAMTLALLHPEMVEQLILISPAGFERFTPGERKWFEEVVTVDGIRFTPVQQIRANIVNNFYNMPDDAEFMITDRIALRGARDFEAYCYAVVQSVRGMLAEPVYDHLEEIKQPTLIIFGENDNLIPNPYLHGGHSRTIANIGDEKIPDSQLVMIPSCGHFAMFEKPADVNRAIEGFLK